MSNATKSKTILLARMVKLHNRRVIGTLFADGSCGWVFKKLEDGKPVKRSMRLTGEAVCAMFAIVRDFKRCLGQGEAGKGDV